MRIFGFAKVRNEIVREGNIYRMLANLVRFCDGGIICDDASTDGTIDVLLDFAASERELGRHWRIHAVPPSRQAFEREMAVKQTMMQAVHEWALAGFGPRPDWIWWADGDEELPRAREMREWLANAYQQSSPHGFRFHYTQLWRNEHWARTDDGFDDGFFVKLWRYSPDLSFDTTEGMHRQQFPKQIDVNMCPIAPFEVIHWGNVGKNLQFKAHQYAGGLGGVDRHLAFGHSPEESLATGAGFDQKHWSKPCPEYRPVPAVHDRAYPPPLPFSLDVIRLIRSMGNLRDLAGWFTVVVPTFNRAADLPRALDSLLYQSYTKWIAIVLDDGSTDDTADVMRKYQDRDPRILYARYPSNRGGVAMNEIGMSMACEMTEFWSRLGSDDWWGPKKLERDAMALADHSAVFGPFTVWKHGRADHVCAGQWNQGSPSDLLKAGQFAASWVNVAVKCSVLKAVRERWGEFCSPELKNMDDFLVNARIAHLTEWAWHDGDHGDAFWNCLEGVGQAHESASANAAVTARDNEITRRLIAEMR